MSHRFGDLLSLHLHRKHGLSQSKLAAGILQEPSIITLMCKGKRLTGRQARERVLAIVDWLNRQDVLATVDEANALLRAAGMSDLDAASPVEALLLQRLAFELVSSPKVPGRLIKRPQLPVAATELVGRTQELADVVQCLSGPACRLLNLVGEGGIGKTRLALAAAAAAAPTFSHGACWVNLQPVYTADALVLAVADAVACPLSGAAPPDEQLLRNLGGKELLLVLDNYEQLIPHDDLLLAILRTAPTVKLLVTSREVLHLQEEWLYPVGRLDYPEAGRLGPGEITWKEAKTYSAVQLFAARARRRAPAFAAEAQCRAIVRICQLTAGIPLAIELAASWISSLSCEEIAGGIAADLDTLTTPLRNVPDRHRTMRAVFEQSWRRLSPGEQEIFRRLSVFRGGFDRRAAGAVTGATLPMLATLVDCSLLSKDAQDRYQVHELLRQYGAARLAESPSASEQVTIQHCRYYTDFLAEQGRLFETGSEKQALAQCLRDMDNSRAAWQAAVDRGMAGALRPAAIAIGWISQMQGRYREGYHLLDSADRRLAQLGAAGSDLAEPAPARAEILAYLGYLAIRIGELDRAEAAALECIALLDSHSFALIPGFTKSPHGALALLAVVRGEFAQAERIALNLTQVSTANGQYWDLPSGYYLWAQAALAQGKLEVARQAAQTSVELCRRYQQNWLVAYFLIGLGEVCAAQGELAAARTHFQAAYQVRKEYSDPEGMAVTLNHLGDVALRLYLGEEAEAHFAAALALYSEISDPGGLATCYKGLGQVAFLRGDVDRTRDCYRQALQTACSVGYTALIMALFTHTGELLLYLEQPEPALAILGFVLGTHQSTYSAKRKVQQILAEGLNNAAGASVEQPLREAELLTFDACLALVSSTLEQPLPNAP